MPLTRDFAFLVDQAKPAGDLVARRRRAPTRR